MPDSLTVASLELVGVASVSDEGRFEVHIDPLHSLLIQMMREQFDGKIVAVNIRVYVEELVHG